MKNNKPWLNSEGKSIPDEELKISSKQWSRETWESYLESLEHYENEEFFLFTKPESIEQIASKDFRDLVTDPSPLSEGLSQEVRSAVNALSPRKKGIIRDSYWNGLTERGQAEANGLHRASIYKQKKKAKAQLKNILLKRSKHLARWSREK